MFSRYSNGIMSTYAPFDDKAVDDIELALVTALDALMKVDTCAWKYLTKTDPFRRELLAAWRQVKQLRLTLNKRRQAIGKMKQRRKPGRLHRTPHKPNPTGELSPQDHECRQRPL